jgi:hypothetical protein
VLETVYAVDTLPDAMLRERLSKYLDLSARQIQVWFQNRRQRSKAGTSGTGSPSKKPNGFTPDQIMDALFDVNSAPPQCALPSSPSTSPAAYPAASPASYTSVPAIRTNSDEGSVTTGSPTAGSPHAASPPSTAVLDRETFEWGLPTHALPPLASHLHKTSAEQGTQSPIPVRAMVVSARPRATAPQPTDKNACAQTDILDALLGFACHELHLEAAELWPLPSAHGPAKEPHFARFASASMGCDSELACCRAMLAPRLCNSAATTHELAWYGITPEQKSAFGAPP